MPTDIDPTIWELGKKLGNIAQADDLLAVAAGEREPQNIGETVALLDCSRRLEDAALKRYAKLQANIGGQLERARADYQANRDRTSRLALLLEDSSALVGRNGHASENVAGMGTEA
jgi:hypothetical protein